MKCIVKSRKPIILDTKWTNYSPQFLENKFSLPKDKALLESRDIFEIDESYQNIVLPPLPDITTFNQANHYTSSSCSSPRDVNEVSLHISLLESKDEIVRDNGSFMQEKNMMNLEYIEEVNIGSGMEIIDESYLNQHMEYIINQ